MLRYNVKNNSRKLSNSRKNLRWIYSQMPETYGCLENISKEDGCGSWCCEKQFPSVWYVEFLNSWNYIVHNWNDVQIKELIERSLRNYLYPKPERGCVFWNKDTKMCNQHEHRSYNCMIYGIEPEEKFNERLVKLKVLYPHTKNQCNLVKIVDEIKVDSKKIEYWWNLLKNTELSIGVSPDLMHDNYGGSYRSYHDHILLHLFDDSHMEMLSNVREHGDPMQKETCIRNMMNVLSNYNFEQEK